MKKLFFSLCLFFMAFSASAQIKTVDLKANVRGNFGLGGGVTMGLVDYVDFAPSFNYYFTEHGATFSADADFHYNIEMDDTWDIYPLAGVCFFHGRNRDGDTRNKLGLDLGCGARYYLSDQVNLFGELKYQPLYSPHGMNKMVLSLGVSLILL